MTSSLNAKLLGLITVVLSVLFHSWISAAEAGWLVWFTLALLILLDACIGHGAGWSECFHGLKKIFGISILPFYAVLAVLLFFGPRYVRTPPSRNPQIMMPNASPSFSGRPNTLPQRPASQGQSTRPPPMIPPGGFTKGNATPPIRPSGNTAPISLPSTAQPPRPANVPVIDTPAASAPAKPNTGTSPTPPASSGK